MPRRTLARRFEPRYGVSEAMIETESTYVAREFDDYLLLSLNDLKERLAKAHGAIDQVEEQLQATLGTMPDRERVALRCLLSRDLWQLGTLYLKMLQHSPHSQATGATSVVAEERITDDEPRPVLAFRQTLFE